jgi:hypothetical protein
MNHPLDNSTSLEWPPPPMVGLSVLPCARGKASLRGRYGRRSNHAPVTMGALNSHASAPIFPLSGGIERAWNTDAGRVSLLSRSLQRCRIEGKMCMTEPKRRPGKEASR